MISFPIGLFLTNQEILYNLNIVPSFYPHFEPIIAFFSITGQVWYLIVLIPDAFRTTCMLRKRRLKTID